MPALPEIISEAWDSREGPMVLTTVNTDAIPNAIYVSCVKKLSEKRVVIADNYFDKTRINILGGSKGSLLFITREHQAFQVKGFFGYYTSGTLYEDMWQYIKNVIQFKQHGVAVLNIEEAYCGSQRLL